MTAEIPGRGRGASGPDEGSIPSDIAGFYARKIRKPLEEELREKRALLEPGEFLDRLAGEIRSVTGRPLGTAVDFGGGSGATLSLLGNRLEIGRRLCYDLVPPSRPLPGVEYVHGSWEDLGRAVPDGTVDLVLAEEVIEHLFSPDAMVARCRRLLKAGGLLVITTPNLSSAVNRLGLLMGKQPGGTEVSTLAVFTARGPLPGPVAGHIRVFAFGALLEFLDFHGFTVIRAYTAAWPPRSRPAEPGRAAAQGRFLPLLERSSARFGRGLASRTVAIARVRPGSGARPAPPAE